jgi:hypothetical protein
MENKVVIFLIKLNDIKSCLHESLFNRHYHVDLLTCRIGHVRVTHSCLLTGRNASLCIACKYFTVKHYLLEFNYLAHARDGFYRVNTLRELFCLSSI